MGRKNVKTDPLKAVSSRGDGFSVFRLFASSLGFFLPKRHALHVITIKNSERAERETSEFVEKGDTSGDRKSEVGKMFAVGVALSFAKTIDKRCS